MVEQSEDQIKKLNTMRYFENLLPEESRVNLHFDNLIQKPSSKISLIAISKSIIGILLFIGTLTIFTWFWFGLCLFALGFFIFPKSSELIERKLGFSFTWKIKLLFVLPFFIGTIIFASIYNERDENRVKTEIKQRQEKEVKDRIAKEESIKKENQRKDSIKYYLTVAYDFSKMRNFHNAIINFKRVLLFSPLNLERIKFEISNLLFQSKDYMNAINGYKELNSNNFGDTIDYQIAQCYIALSDKKTAVQYLKCAIDKSSERANKLYDKINPEKKRIIGYETLCCDGTTSTNKGRGACSHHGGVCDWHHPIYEKYREY